MIILNNLEYDVKEDGLLPLQIKQSMIKQAEQMLNKPKRYINETSFTSYYDNWEITIYKRTGTIGAWIGLTIANNNDYYDLSYGNFYIMFKVYTTKKYVRWLVDEKLNSLPGDLLIYLITIFFNDKIHYMNKNMRNKNMLNHMI